MSKLIITEADRIPEDFLIGKTYTIGGHSHYSTWVLKKMVWPFAYLETPKSGKKMETHQANLRLTPADAMEVAKLRMKTIETESFPWVAIEQSKCMGCNNEIKEDKRFCSDACEDYVIDCISEKAQEERDLNQY
jgi:hypothetical protein